MPNKILNTTSLTYEYTNSKSPSHLLMSTAATMSEGINISLVSLEKNYYLNESITYLITITNHNNSKIENPTITNNLGSYEKITDKNASHVTPLDYIGPSYLYLNGIFQNKISPEIKSNKIIFNPPDIPEKSTILIIFKTSANHFSPFSSNSNLECKTSLKLLDSQNTFEASHSISIAKKANLKIFKSISPQLLSRGETIYYNVALYNYGNATAKNIKITDTFDPAPTITNITINDQEISQIDYSYINGTFNLPAYGSNLDVTVPSAKFETEDTSCITSIHPGVTNIVITGTI